MENRQRNVREIVQLVLKAVAVGMSVATIVLGYIGGTTVETQVAMLSLGVFALSVAALQSEPTKRGR